MMQISGAILNFIKKLCPIDLGIITITILVLFIKMQKLIVLLKNFRQKRINKKKT